jgi:hypothetical protein
MSHRASLVTAFICSLLVVACSDDGSEGVSGDRVTPEDTSAQASTVFPASENGEPQLLSSMSCAADELTILTTSRTVRAALPCDRFPPTDVVERFREEPTEIQVRPGSPGKILLRAAAAGSLEFTVDDVQIQPR